MKTKLPLILVLALAIMLISAPAFAYIDPGTGSMVIQGLIAIVIGASVAIKMFWHRIKSIFTGKPLEKDDDTEEE